jgi:hypothetical protein
VKDPAMKTTNIEERNGRRHKKMETLPMFMDWQK